MTLIEDILVVLFGLSAVYFVFYVWGSFFVRCTSDLKILHKCQRFPILGPLASRKLETIYRKQLEECSSSEVAHRISVATQDILPYVSQRASSLEEALIIYELRNAIEESRDDEETLLKLFGPICSASSSLSHRRDGELFSVFWVALRPFTEKRIREAATVKELVLLTGEEKKPPYTLPWVDELDRIKKSLKPLYERKLKRLLLLEALATSQFNDVNNDCFHAKCEDGDVNMLVVAKRALLCLSPQVNSFCSSDELLSKINLTLMKYLEQQNECCS